jgi:hypothetical protein
MSNDTWWYHLVPDPVVLKRLGQRRELRCMCCKTRYRRGEFRCCAPPNGMASRNWLAMGCPDPPKGCGKCAKHCVCPNREQRLGPLAELARSFMEKLPR